MHESLALILPVRNTAGTIEETVDIWFRRLRDMDAGCTIHLYNDGSGDGTGTVLSRIASRLPDIVVHHRSTSGYGATVLAACRDCSSRYDWLLLVDADRDLPVNGAAGLWKIRKGADLLAGTYKGMPGRGAAGVSARLLLRLCCGKGPARGHLCLARAEAFTDLFARLPDSVADPALFLGGYAAARGLVFRSVSLPGAGIPAGTTGKTSSAKAPAQPAPPVAPAAYVPAPPSALLRDLPELVRLRFGRPMIKIEVRD